MSDLFAMDNPMDILIKSWPTWNADKAIISLERVVSSASCIFIRTKFC